MQANEGIRMTASGGRMQPPGVQTDLRKYEKIIFLFFNSLAACETFTAGCWVTVQ